MIAVLFGSWPEHYLYVGIGPDNTGSVEHFLEIGIDNNFRHEISDQVLGKILPLSATLSIFR